VGKTLITNGTIVTAADTYKADVLVDREKVAMIGQGLKAAGAKRIDATASADRGVDFFSEERLASVGDQRGELSCHGGRLAARRNGGEKGNLHRSDERCADGQAR
jgi:hypothetical protein